jgi:hypothetical protein
MIPNPFIEVYTSPVGRPWVPLWTKGLLDAFAHQVRLVRVRFGHHELGDFLAPLLGYAISGERTLANFFERLAPLNQHSWHCLGADAFPIAPV